MKTSDFRINISSEKLNESLQQKFGGKVDIQNFTDSELIKASKLIENKISAFKKADFNATLENEEFFKLKLMKDVIDTRMREVFGEAKEKTMSRAAKGMMKYGKDGMKALAKAGKDGKSLDKVRDKYNKYDESKKPDADGDGVPDWADKKPGKDDNEGQKPSKKGLSAKQQKFFGKKKTVKEGWKGGLLGGGLAGLLGGGPLGIGLGYLGGSKVGDDLSDAFSEDVDMGTRAAHHAIMYRHHHHKGDLEGAAHHKAACDECGGMLEHNDLGECWMSHPEIAEGQAQSVDEGLGKLLGYGALGAGLGGLGAYAMGNPEALGGIGGYLNTGAKAVGDVAGPYVKSAGDAISGFGSKLLKESDNSMCELAMHHAAMYQKSHKMGNLKHCEHHKTNVEECGGKVWHDGTGEVYFSHHGHRNGVPEKVSEGFYSALGGLGGGIGGAVGGHHIAPALAKGASAVATGLGYPIDPATADIIGSGLGIGAGSMLGSNLGGKVGTEGKKMSPKDKKLAAKYPPKDKITRGDIITAAKEKKKTTENYDRMLKESIRFYLREGEEGKAEVIMAVKDMVDKFTGWSEDIAQMQANTAMEMADSIRDELGSDVSAQFTQVAGPALDSAFQAVKAAREALNSIVGVITGEGGAAMGGMPGMPAGPGGMPGAPAPGGMPPMGGTPPMDPGAAGPGAGAEDEEDTGKRAKRESVDRTRRIARLLVGR